MKDKPYVQMSDEQVSKASMALITSVSGGRTVAAGDVSPIIADVQAIAASAICNMLVSAAYGMTANEKDFRECVDGARSIVVRGFVKLIDERLSQLREYEDINAKAREEARKEGFLEEHDKQREALAAKAAVKQ